MRSDRRTRLAVAAAALTLSWPAIISAQQADGIEIHDTVVRRAIIPQDSDDRAAGPVVSFDIVAFRGDIADRGPAVDPGTDPTDELPVVLPREYIDWQAGERTAGPPIIDDFYLISAIDQGASYGYQTTEYTVEVTARTVTSVPTGMAAEAMTVSAGRSPLEQVRTGYAGTINTANVGHFVEISCSAAGESAGEDLSEAQVEAHEDEAAPSCLLDGAADELYASFLECANDGLCYQIEGSAK